METKLWNNLQNKLLQRQERQCRDRIKGGELEGKKNRKFVETIINSPGDC